jgi:hypothetical protein
MPLQPLEPTEDLIAHQIAQRSLAQLVQAAQQIVTLRTAGVPAVAAIPATPEETLPDGRKVSARPARPATIAISAAALDKAYKQSNCEVLDQIKELLGL